MSAVTFIKELIKQQEHHSLEFKSSLNVEAILKTICAFLNTNGGWIIVNTMKRN
ncbi:MAG: ATP-binding protein [Saprospiraceae bacterium]|nr:ATP-binding protein [Saprospiraceae bacterium]